MHTIYRFLCMPYVVFKERVPFIGICQKKSKLSRTDSGRPSYYRKCSRTGTFHYIPTLSCIHITRLVPKERASRASTGVRDCPFAPPLDLPTRSVCVLWLGNEMYYTCPNNVQSTALRIVKASHKPCSDPSALAPN